MASHFHSACFSYLEQAGVQPLSLGSHQYARGWVWQHPTQAVLPSSAGLVRSFDICVPTATSSSDTDELTEPIDDSATHAALTQTVRVHQSVHWSSTWRVPVLYFHASWPSGQPLSLDELSTARVIHNTGTLQSALVNPQTDGSYFAPISYGDHPRTGLPSFYLHPCQTAHILSDILPPSHPDHLYIAAFLSLCASAVEMRA